MKAAIMLLFIIATGRSVGTGPQLSELRRLYGDAGTEKTAMEKLSELLSPVDKLSAPVMICYKGAVQMMEAKYMFNPYSKFQKFNAGKSLIEYAIKLDTANVEMRYLRCTIQTNIPAFLGYNINAAADRRYLVNSFDTIDDKQLKDMVGVFLNLKGASAGEQKIEKN